MHELRIRDVRSVWGPPVDVPLGPRVSVLVGPNRSGTSNVAWTLAATLDPARDFRPARDVPRRRREDATPSATLRLADGRHTEVRWDPVSGRRQVTGDLPTGHVIWAPIDRTAAEIVAASPADLTDVQVRDRVAVAVRELAEVVLPGIASADVTADGEVEVRDDLGSAIPGPELRALVALALARAMSTAGAPPAAVVIEAPEVFLHPAGQETVADLLVAVATETGAPVVTTTTSPFSIPRTDAATVVALARDRLGRTSVVASARGDAPQARLLGGLLRDPGLAAVLDRIGTLAGSARGVLIVEGGTDEAYLRQAARTLGREDTLAGLAIRPAGGAMAAAAAAIVLRAESDLPVAALLDNDPAGRRALETLVSRFGFDRQREVLTYADILDGGPPGVEAETLFDPGLLRRFVRERGPSASHGEVRLPHGHLHIDLTSSGKSAFVGWLDVHARPEHLARWGQLLELLEERFPD